MTDATKPAAASREDAFSYVAARVASRWPGARAVMMDPLRGDASSREYSRVTIETARSGAPASSS
jgi:hypothetical protein